MARYLFPQDRLVFRYGAPGTPLYSPQSEVLTIFTDEAATIPAGLQDPDGVTIDNALEIGTDCLIPEFKGPDGLTTLWAKNRTGQVVPLYAQTGQFIANQGLDGALTMPNVVATPATPTTGGVLYAQAGALKYKGSNGTVTTIAPA